MTLELTKPPAAIRGDFAANGMDDRYLTVTARGSLSGLEDKVAEAVRTATRKAGGSSSKCISAFLAI